jgi:methionyl aminopeptidase
MSIESPEDLEALRRIGRIVGLTIAEVERHLVVGITTAELDAIAAAFLARHGATPAPRRSYGFPGAVMLSLDDEAVHAVPGPRRIHPGALVKIDVTAELDGYVADAADTVAVAPVGEVQRRLIDCARAAFRRGARAARAGNPVRRIGREVEAEVRRRGFTVLRELGGHGVGRAIHEEPQVLNYDAPWNRARLTDGLVLTIEPIIAAGRGRTVLSSDRWTIRTADGSLAAHYEHSLVVTRDRPILLTQVA